MTTSKEEPEIVLYDLACTKNECFSPVVWLIRMLLHHKKIPYRAVFLEFPDIEPELKKLGVPLPQDAQKYTVPTIHHLPTNYYLMDSTAIAAFLEKTYPHPPVPLETPAGQTFLANALTAVGPTLSRSSRMREINVLSPRAAEYFRRTREAQIGHKLEELWASPEEEDEAWKVAESKMDPSLVKGPFIEGKEAGHADLMIVGAMQCARVIDEGIFQRLCRIPQLKGMYDACDELLERKD